MRDRHWGVRCGVREDIQFTADMTSPSVKSRKIKDNSEIQRGQSFLPRERAYGQY
jgi:hypothetical protein